MCTSRVGGSGNLGGRYGVGRSESPMKGSPFDRGGVDYGIRSSAADRLANDFNKLQGPSGRGASTPSYLLAHR